MALRVLLADESNTIKKVFQLALQDYAVDVRPVNVGLDVIQVAEKFNPDIVFADVLLQKKSGYEVCAEIKSHSGLKHLPVVLMWSGFMELDQDRFDASGADGKLEKPFDVNSLRRLIQEFVPRTQEQKISQYLSFPKMPEMLPEEAPPAAVNESVRAAEQDNAQESESEWTIESFDPIKTPETQEPEPQDEDETWQRQDLSRFKVDIDPDSSDEDLPTEEILQAQDEAIEPGPPPPPPLELETELDVDMEPELETEEWQPQSPADFRPDLTGTHLTSAEPIPPRPSAPISDFPPRPQPPNTSPSLSAEQIEAIVREQARESIEAAVWQIVPELAQQIIERELKKILDDKESNLY